MDTLSRKHRLRQQQLLQLQDQQQQQLQQPTRRNQQQQVLYGSRNGQVKVAGGDQQFDQRYNNGYDTNASTSQYSNQYYRYNNNEEPDEDEQEHFRVYQVNRVADKHHKPLERDNERTVAKSNKLNSTLMVSNRLHGVYDDDYAACQPFVCKNGDLAPAGHRQRPTSSAYYATANDCSTGDSSGFQSSGFCETSPPVAITLQSTKLRQPKQHSKSGRQRANETLSGQGHERSLVLDELDRLQLFQHDTSSPTDSTCTNSTLARTSTRGDTTLVRGRERGYSELCREEFSNYIPAVSDQRSGPTLIGVHQESTNSTYELADDTWSSSSPVGDAEMDDYAAICHDHELQLPHLANHPSISPAASHLDDRVEIDWNLDSLEKYDNLTEQVNIFLTKIDCMIRLADGQHVGIMEAFGCAEIDVSEVTPLCTKPLEGVQRCNKFVLDYQILDACDDGQTTTKQLLRHETISRTILSGEERQDIQSDSPAHHCDCIELDWDKVEVPTIDQVIASEVDFLHSKYAALEESLLDNLIGSKPQATGHRARHQVDLVEGHLSEFLNDYLDYQAEFKRNTTFATGWRENWLFASRWSSANDQWPMQVCNSRKRTKLDTDTDVDYAVEDRLRDSEGQIVDLFKYSTLTLIKHKPIKLTYLDCDISRVGCEIESSYKAQDDLLNELQARSLEFAGQVDACCQLLRMDTKSADDDDDAVKLSAGPKQTGPRLRVSYSSSLASNKRPHQLIFAAFGYLFELPQQCSNEVPKSKINQLKSRLLDKFRELTVGHPSKPIAGPAEGQVRFLVNLADVALVNKLPVIQFCAKFTGSLPISVRWFRGQEEGENVGCELKFEEMSDISDSKRRRNLRLNQRPSREDCTSSSWPIEMHANYDYEYQTDWSSWFRFRRCRSDILFELRNADETRDHNTTYKCLIQNYCSQQECQFTLTRRKPPRLSTCTIGPKQIRRPMLVESKGSGKDGHALLRSWSQRTLHRPVPTVVNGDSDSSAPAALPEMELETTSKQEYCIGKHLRCDDSNEDKFGQDFPYHPANLLKRLKENKYLVVQRTGNKTNPSVDDNHDSPQQQGLTGANYNEMPISESMDSFEFIEVEQKVTENHKNLDENENELSRKQQQHRIDGTWLAKRDACENDAQIENDRAEVEPLSAGGKRPVLKERATVVVPKPRLRLKLQDLGADFDHSNETKQRTELRYKGQPTDRIICQQSENQSPRQVNHRQTTTTESVVSETIAKRMDSATGAKPIVCAADQRDGKRLESCRGPRPDVRPNQTSRPSNSSSNSEDCNSKTSVKSLISRFSLA